MQLLREIHHNFVSLSRTRSWGEPSSHARPMESPYSSAHWISRRLGLTHSLDWIGFHALARHWRDDLVSCSVELMETLCEVQATATHGHLASSTIESITEMNKTYSFKVRWDTLTTLVLVFSSFLATILISRSCQSSPDEHHRSFTEKIMKITSTTTAHQHHLGLNSHVFPLHFCSLSCQFESEKMPKYGNVPSNFSSSWVSFSSLWGFSELPSSSKEKLLKNDLHTSTDWLFVCWVFPASHRRWVDADDVFMMMLNFFNLSSVCN